MASSLLNYAGLLQALTGPRGGLAKFVRAYFVAKRKEGMKDRFAIARMYRADYGEAERENMRQLAWKGPR